MILAHLIVTYDFRLEDANAPRVFTWNTSMIPRTSTRVADPEAPCIKYEEVRCIPQGFFNQTDRGHCIVFGLDQVFLKKLSEPRWHI